MMGNLSGQTEGVERGLCKRTPVGEGGRGPRGWADYVFFLWTS